MFFIFTENFEKGLFINILTPKIGEITLTVIAHKRVSLRLNTPNETTVAYCLTEPHFPKENLS